MIHPILDQFNCLIASFFHISQGLNYHNYLTYNNKICLSASSTQASISYYLHITSFVVFYVINSIYRYPIVLIYTRLT